jgi:ABC-2 type transport system ATP-binding protein
LDKLEVRHLRREFGSKAELFVAVEDLSFTLSAGSILALLGPNGAGKTTTVQMLGGYLAPTSGEILLDGQPLHSLPHRGRNHFGIVFGGEQGFYGRATAQDNLVFFANLAGLPRARIKSEVARVLEQVELTNNAQKRVGEFSRGMRQRLHIARALLGEPEILLLDEPTNGLDVEIAHEIRGLIQTLAQNGTAVLLTSHTMSEIESLADRVLLLGGGKIFHDGTVESVVALSQVHHIDRAATLEESYLALAPQLRRR